MKQIVLLKPHEHAGKKLAPGSSLFLIDSKAEWLVAQRVARFANPQDIPAAPQTQSAPRRTGCCGWKPR